jgi:hypothetical protein
VCVRTVLFAGVAYAADARWSSRVFLGAGSGAPIVQLHEADDGRAFSEPHEYCRASVNTRLRIYRAVIRLRMDRLLQRRAVLLMARETEREHVVLYDFGQVSWAALLEGVVSKAYGNHWITVLILPDADDGEGGRFDAE